MDSEDTGFGPQGDPQPEPEHRPEHEHQPEPEPRPEPAAAGMASMAGKLSQAERVLALGAVLIFADYLILDLIIDEYFFFTGTLLLAGIALFAAWVRQSRPAAAWPLPHDWVVKVLGYSVGFLGLIELLTDLRGGVLDRAADIIGGIVLYVGAFLMFWGAQQTKGSTGS